MKYLYIPLLASGLLVASTSSNADQRNEASSAVVRPLVTRALQDVHGKEVTMLTVEYPPGGASPPHKHEAHTFVYVLEGEILMQVEGGKETRLRAGETFYESPSDIHTVSRNASKTQPAKFLVFFLKNAGAPASMPVSH